MKTGNRKATVHKFKATNKGKYKGTIHYELVSGKPFLNSNTINISKDRQCANSSPSYWLKIREGSKWSECITGLFQTKEKFVFRGDHNKRESLILFKFSGDATELTIFYFENYFVGDLCKVLNQIQK